jgi:hypothetical protein
VASAIQSHGQELGHRFRAQGAAPDKGTRHLRQDPRTEDPTPDDQGGHVEGEGEASSRQIPSPELHASIQLMP